MCTDTHNQASRVSFLDMLRGRAILHFFSITSIISTMREWVHGSYRPVDTQVLVKMREFALSIISSTPVGEKAREIAAVIEQMVSLPRSA
jgi:hypothetical protein